MQVLEDPDEGFLKSMRDFPTDAGRNSITRLLYEAVGSNELTFVREALAGRHGEIPSEDLHLALMVAAERGHKACLLELLQHNVSAMPNVGGDTALIVAAGKGYAGIVQILIDHGCPVNYINGNNYTALKKACENGHIKVVEVLIENGANESNEASPTVKRSPFRCDLTGGMFAGSRFHHDMPGVAFGCTSLMISALQGRDHCKDMMKLVIKANAALDARDIEGKTVLHYAARDCSPDIVEFLLQEGADSNVRDTWGLTPLMTACTYNKMDNVRVLLEKGANVNMLCNAERSVLDIAVRRGCIEMIQMFINAGCSVNHIDIHGQTTLHIAMTNYNYAAIKCLLQSGCSPNILIRNFNAGRVMDSFDYAIYLKDLIQLHMLYEAGALSMGEMYERYHDPENRRNCSGKPDVMNYLQELVSRPRSLASICRIVIRKSLQRECLADIDKLPLPKYVKEYLLFSDIQY